MAATVAQTYVRELYPLRHGYPLFFPDYPADTDITIGDVGYVTSDGVFLRLFNAARPEGDVLNCNGVPEGFSERLQYHTGVHGHTLDPYLPPQPLLSRSIRIVEGGVDGGYGSAKLCYAVKQSREQGALLVLGSPAVKEVANNPSRFKAYMSKHRDAWYKLALKLDHDIQKKDLVLVYGWVKTDQWALAAHLSTTGSHEFSVSGDVWQMFHAGAFVASSREAHFPVHVRRGPKNRKNGSVNQTLFLRRIKARSFGLKAAAGPHQLPSHSRDSDAKDEDSVWASGLSAGLSSSSSDFSTDEVEIHDPLDGILDYIFKEAVSQKLPGCRVAIACDDDMDDLLMAAQLGHDIVVNIPDLLRRVSPRIGIDIEHGIASLSFASDSADLRQSSLDQQESANARGGTPEDFNLPPHGPTPDHLEKNGIRVTEPPIPAEMFGNQQEASNKPVAKNLPGDRRQSYSARMTEARSELRRIVKAAIQDITGDETALMCWGNYWKEIVERRGVVIVGWPYDDVPFRNVSDVSNVSTVELLISGWRTGRIRFCHVGQIPKDQLVRLHALHTAPPALQ